MVDKPLDLSVMTLDWVNATEDPIFKDLSRGDSRRLARILNMIRRSSYNTGLKNFSRSWKTWNRSCVN